MQRNRREFVQVVGAGAAGLTMGGGRFAEGAEWNGDPRLQAAAAGDGPILQVGEKIAVAETAGGKVRGYILRGIHYYLGI
ncbi:MAG: pnbA 1, partial [Acidobacteria bacterium]|nr:pnbA 1 [Acidobacteriota bacterium]